MLSNEPAPSTPLIYDSEFQRMVTEHHANRQSGDDTPMNVFIDEMVRTISKFAKYQEEASRQLVSAFLPAWCDAAMGEVVKKQPYLCYGQFGTGKRNTDMHDSVVFCRPMLSMSWTT
jgi:hypothetical protein